MCLGNGRDGNRNVETVLDLHDHVHHLCGIQSEFAGQMRAAIDYADVGTGDLQGFANHAFYFVSGFWHKNRAAFQAATGRRPPSLTWNRKWVASRILSSSWRSRKSLRVPLR